MYIYYKKKCIYIYIYREREICMYMYIVCMHVIYLAMKLKGDTQRLRLHGLLKILKCFELTHEVLMPPLKIIFPFCVLFFLCNTKV